MTDECRRRVRRGVRVVSMSAIVFAVAAFTGLALSHARPASAQAPDMEFLLPPDSEVEIGDPFLCPPEDDLVLLGLLDAVSVHVLQPEAIPGWDWPLPVPRRKAPADNQGNYLCAMGGPPGGTYRWEATTGWEGEGPTPLFFCATTGMNKTATVTYTHPTEGSAQDTSGNIHIFDAELTLDGLADATEESPGGGIAVGGARKRLTITLTPQNPTDLVGSSYVQGQPRQDFAHWTATLTGGTQVRFYDAEEDGNQLTQDDLAWGWKYKDFNPGPPQVEEGFYLKAGPSEVWVEAVETGTCDITLTLTTATRWLVPDQISATDKVHVAGVTAELHHVYFLSDHGVLNDWTGNYAADGKDVYSPRGWCKLPAANNPVSHTLGQNVQVEVGLTMSPAGVPFALSGTSTATGLDFDAVHDVSTGQLQVLTATANQPLSATTEPPLAPTVGVLNTPIQWTVSVLNPACVEGSGPHEVFVTWGFPGIGPTHKRVDYVCSEAPGASSPRTIADGLHAAVKRDTHFGGGGIAGWPLLDGGSGKCDGQAKCMVLTVFKIGAGPAYLRRVYGTQTYGTGECLSLDTRWGPAGIEYLVLDFDTGPGHAWNAFEGCCEAADHYYAITPFLDADDDYQMLLTIPCQQYWVRTEEDIEPGEDGWEVLTVIQEWPKQ